MIEFMVNQHNTNRYKIIRAIVSAKKTLEVQQGRERQQPESRTVYSNMHTPMDY